jgi:hypothetical protein
MKKVAYVAADHGPRATLQALAAQLPGTDSLDSGTELLICGASDSAEGRAIEARARIAAKQRAVPCVVLEDFPGNYSIVRGGEPRLLLVDSGLAMRLAHAKEGALNVQVVPAVRYDLLRRRLAALRRPSNGADAVLWIGQPETEDSLTTLRRLLQALSARSVRVWLRAHPRDTGYSDGAYAGLDVEDVTSSALEDCLARRPRLVITQFSSVAIEAGFWGIPSLNVLFPDAGGRTLASRKGYSVPPWCDQGAAFLLVDAQDTDKVLDRALGSEDARNSVMQAFDGYFKVREEGAPVLINLLYNQGLL